MYGKHREARGNLQKVRSTDADQIVIFAGPKVLAIDFARLENRKNEKARERQEQPYDHMLSPFWNLKHKSCFSKTICPKLGKPMKRMKHVRKARDGHRQPLVKRRKYAQGDIEQPMRCTCRVQRE